MFFKKIEFDKGKPFEKMGRKTLEPTVLGCAEY
jgi:hypothetical protein